MLIVVINTEYRRKRIEEGEGERIDWFRGLEECVCGGGRGGGCMRSNLSCSVPIENKNIGNLSEKMTMLMMIMMLKMTLLMMLLLILLILMMFF